MAISQSRKWNMVGLATLLLAGTLVSWAPLIIARWQIHRFCGELNAGASPASVQALAEARGYDATPLADGTMAIEDPRTLGRGACIARFGAGGLTSAD